MTHSSTPSADRSRPGRRFDVTTVLAVVLPLLTVGALALVGPDDTAPAAAPPEETALTRAVAICPGGAPEAVLATANGAAGSVDYLLGDAEGSADVTADEVATVSGGRGPLVVRAEGDLAPGLVAGRFDSPLASAECRAPVPDQWFTGVGSGARHTSVLELVNPDAGPAVVDATLYGVSGVVDAPELRGVAVPGRGVVRLSLAELVPRRDELALHVTTSRGRVTASLRERYQQLGTGGASEDWLRSQDAPATSNLLLGLAPGSGLRTLVLLNPGDDETRARVRLVSEQSVFSPAGLEEVVLPPQSVTRVSLTELMRGQVGEGTLGVLVESPEPVAATVRTYAGGDLSHAVPGTPFADPVTVLAPRGDKQVVLAGATGAGTVTVTARAADGELLGEERIEVVAGRGYVVDVPGRAVLLTVTPQRTEVVGSVLVSDGEGATVLRLREQVTSGLIGSVRPGLP
jgi:hypothetical protein